MHDLNFFQTYQAGDSHYSYVFGTPGENLTNEQMSYLAAKNHWNNLFIGVFEYLLEGRRKSKLTKVETNKIIVSFNEIE